MRLNETEMVKLLPAWMQEDGSDKGIATGCDIISRDAYARLKLLSRWDKIDQLSDAELDEMAWELNIQWYFFSYFPELKPSPKGDTTHGPKTEQPRKQVEGQVRQPVRQPDRLDRGR